jgi:predicted ATPase with chaperone activity
LVKPLSAEVKLDPKLAKVSRKEWTHARRECHCSPVQIQRYDSKISGPLLDRIDIHIEVPAVQHKELRGGVEVESSVRGRVPARSS